jgi:hypothetical protein
MMAALSPPSLHDGPYMMAALSPPSLHDGPYMMAALSPPSLYDGAIIVLIDAIISKQFIEQFQQWHETKQQD